MPAASTTAKVSFSVPRRLKTCVHGLGHWRFILVFSTQIHNFETGQIDVLDKSFPPPLSNMWKTEISLYLGFIKYDVHATCLVYYLFFLDRQFRGDVAILVFLKTMACYNPTSLTHCRKSSKNSIEKS
jgi:hypothetical protein